MCTSSLLVHIHQVRLYFDVCVCILAGTAVVIEKLLFLSREVPSEGMFNTLLLRVVLHLVARRVNRCIRTLWVRAFLRTRVSFSPIRFVGLTSKNVKRHVNVKLSVKAVCQGKSPYLDIWPLSPVEKRPIICMEIPIMLFVIWVLRAISWRISRKHLKFIVSWPSLVSYKCLHAYAAMYYPTPCSLSLCGSCA